MATDIYINIKDLPELSQINNGDYILVETSTGTHTLNFENLLLPIENTVITTTVNQNASAFNSYFSNLSSDLESLFTGNDTISSNLETLSSKLETNYQNINNIVSQVSGLNIKNATATIKQGDYSTSTVLNIGVVFDSENILITPQNKYAALYPAYVDSVDSATNLINIKGTFNKQVANFNSALSTVSLSTNYIAAEEDAIYNVFVIKN